MDTVGDDFPQQQARVRRCVERYRELDGTPGVNVKFAIAALTDVLERADRAAISGDVVAILRSYEEMKGCE